jgi:hypothetical protein
MGVGGRRSQRVTMRVPLHLEGELSSGNAHTAVVNRHGALILCPVRYPEGAELEVWNLESGERARARVAWYGGQDLPGLHKEGIEILAYGPRFWGQEYDKLAGH